MKIAVLIKQVPDMEQVKFDREKGVIDRTSAGYEINPFDLNALELALSIKEIIGGEVLVLTMGPLSAEHTIKEGIARGADDGILLTDSRFAGADVKATGLVLAAAIQKLAPVDLIIAGMQSVDGDTGQVGPEVAEFLNLPHIAFVEKMLDLNEKNITVSTKIWGGHYDITMPFPGLITVTKDLNTPRLASLKGKIKAKKAVIKRWSYEDLLPYLLQEEVGRIGSATWVQKIEVAPMISRHGKIWQGQLTDGIVEISKKIKEVIEKE